MTVYILTSGYTVPPTHIDVANFTDELVFVLHENPQ